MKMSLVSVMKSYVKKMIDESEPGYKVMLLDKHTTSFVSLVLGMSEIMKQEVYMFEQLGQLNYSENMAYLKCIVFIRPTSYNVGLLCQELLKPRYGSYYIYFSNVISKNEVKLLAEADEHEVVQEVQEIYADFLSLSPHLFSLSLPSHSKGLKWAPDALQRCVLGLSGVLFSLQHMPTIRYQNNSELCRTLAENIRQNLMKEGLLYTESQPKDNSLLLLLDRRDDPVTPLLHQWTYEAMVHELLGVHNGRVKLGHVPGIAEDLKEVVMTPCVDEFYAKSMYLNYGDIGQTIKELMEEYQKKLSKQQKVESLTDMKHFVESYPQFKKMSGTVSKHVTVLGELSRLVAAYKLMEVSECEQELVCGSDHGNSLQRIRELITSDKVRERDVVKLVMLYALRYQNSPNNDLRGLVAALRRRSVSEDSLKCISLLVEYAGVSQRQSVLFDTPLPQDVSSIKRRFFKGVQGVDNVYTQHKTLLSQTLSAALKGRLREAHFPFCGSAPPAVGSESGAAGGPKPQVIVVFIVGGITFEEAHAVHLLNVSTPSLRVYLGGNLVHNSESFLESVREAMEGLPPRKTLRL